VVAALCSLSPTTFGTVTVTVAVAVAVTEGDVGGGGEDVVEVAVAWGLVARLAEVDG